MTIPAWLSNLEMEMALAVADPTHGQSDTVLGYTFRPFEYEVALLAAYCPAIHRWMDATRVQGSVEARRVWARTCRLFLQFAHFGLLRGDRGAIGSAVEQIVTTCVRLNGVRMTPDDTTDEWVLRRMRVAERCASAKRVCA